MLLTQTSNELCRKINTLCNEVYSYTGATLGPLQCMHSVHYSACPVYTLIDTDIESGNIFPSFPSVVEPCGQLASLLFAGG